MSHYDDYLDFCFHHGFFGIISGSRKERTFSDGVALDSRLACSCV
jgi:hypothetical protein